MTAYPTTELPGVTIIQGSCLDVLPTLPAGSVDAVITDPPYPEIDRPYGRLTEAEWHCLMRDVVLEVQRVLKPSGSAVFILQPNSEKLGRMRPWLWEFMAWTARDWNQVQDVWWWNTTTMPCAGTMRTVGLLRPSLKACVWLGSPDCFRNQDAVLWQETQHNQHKRQSARSEIIYYPSGHHVNRSRMQNAALERGGVTPYNLLPISNTNSNSSGGAYGHGAATPLPLCSWWTRYIAPRGSVVLDPFCGSGTVGIAAVQEGCTFIGIEKEADYCEIAKKRIAPAAAQETLRF